MLLAAGLQPDNPGGAVVQRDVQILRDAANAIMIRLDFDGAERLLRAVRPESLPKAGAATYHLLHASIRVRQQKFEEVLVSCDAAQACQPDLPGSDYLRTVAFNKLRRGDAALKHARLAREWLGDDPIVCFEMGLALHGLRRFAEAAPNFRKVLDNHPSNQDAFVSLLRGLGPDVKNDDIAERFAKLTRPQDHFEVCAQDRWMSRDVTTLQALAEVMGKLEPRHADAKYYLALAHAEQQRIAPALESFRAAVELQEFAGRRDHYYAEFAKSIALHDHALEAYAKLPDRIRSFRALGEALKIYGRMDELRELLDLHRKNHAQDGYTYFFQAELHLRNEEFDHANRAFADGMAALKNLQPEARDLAMEDRFRDSRVRARYETGDVLGAYRDIGPQNATFQQLASSCWFDKKAKELGNLIEAHVKNDPNDPDLKRYTWRVKILDKRFDDAGKALKAALGGNPPNEQNRYLVDDFLFDMIDGGLLLEAYRQAPDPSAALDLLASELAGVSRTKDLATLLDEHRKRFPKDPMLQILTGQQAAAKQDWGKAAKDYSEGWQQLPEAKRLRWTHAYLFARVKEGQALKAYHESGKRPEHFRQLAAMVLQNKEIDLFERLLEAHRPQRANDSEFGAYEARLKVLRGKSAEAVQLLAGVLENRPLHDQRRIADSVLSDLSAFDVAAEAYRCVPDKLDAFAHMQWRYRNPERAKEYERLIAEHAKHHPDDPRLAIERAELHMLRNEFAKAEAQFLLAKTKGAQGPDLARFGLIRARIKLGKAADTYRELGASTIAFQDIANQCFALKDAAQLERVLVAHRAAFPALKSLLAWDVEIHWLKKDYEATVKAIQAGRTGLLKDPIRRWKMESYLVRSLVRLKKPTEAVREAETITKRKQGQQVLLALALTSTGDVPRVLAFLESKKGQPHFIDDCYYDEDLGPILRGNAYKELHTHFPPPPERKPPDRPFDDWD